MTAPPRELLAEVERRARTLVDDVLAPVSTRFEFEPVPPAAETTGPPLVLFLGNHSSGKSSFINWLVGEEVQRTGIAPVDDGFTIITHGREAQVRAGDAVVTNPALAFGDLERFGPTLLAHLKLRELTAPALEGIALVDSPGMIDAADARVNRGYDFPAVVRWFAERADVILLMFDPDKPGTTGETLKVLIDSLAGLDHKLLLIFNKVDRFDTMRDYARAYGALCWNLSKAIPRKDLPHIFNTYLPGRDVHTSPIPLDDFDKQRDEVRGEVARAPYRRVDNVISRVYQHARRLRVHALVVDRLVRERRWQALRWALGGAVVLLAAALTAWLGWSYGGESRGGILLWTALAAVVLLGILYFLFAWDRRVRVRELSLDGLFERTFARQLTLRDDADDLRALWASVRDRVRRALDSGVPLGTLGRGELRRLDRAIREEIPELRAFASRETPGEAAQPRRLAPPASTPPDAGPEPGGQGAPAPA